MPQNPNKQSDIQIINSTGKTINDIINKKIDKNENKNPSPEAGIYSIKCATWNKPYIGETSTLLKKRIYEHKHILLKNDTSYALVLHRNKEKHNFDLKGGKIIKHIPNTKKRLAIESAVIFLTETIKQRSGKFQLSPTLAQLIIIEHNINKQLR